MNVLNFNSEQCLRVRRQLDAYLSNELLVETTSDILRHLESCPACSRELETRTRLRDALRKAAASQAPSEVLRQSIHRRLRESEPGFFGGSRRLAWAVAFAVIIVLLGGIVVQQWLSLQRGKGHNYPNVANPTDQLRRQLGPQFARLLDVVQQKLPGFEVLEAHICSIPGSPRKYVHFITRGRGTILSVILTRSEGAQFPNGRLLRAGDSGSVNLYAAHLDGMNAAGFESSGYLGFVVSDLSPAITMQLASALAPPMKAALDASGGAEAGLDLYAVPPAREKAWVLFAPRFRL